MKLITCFVDEVRDTTQSNCYSKSPIGKVGVYCYLARYLNFVWPQTQQVLDLDLNLKGKKFGRDSGIFNKEHPLTLESRAGVGKMD
jgi:hypothetical protein